MKKTGVYHHGDLRTALLDGVAQIIRETGVVNVSLREVARRIGVSHGAPAHHFSSKQILLTAFATEGFAKLAADTERSVQAEKLTDSRERLRAIGRGYVRFAVAHPEYFEVMFRSDLVDHKDRAFVAASDAAFNILKQCVDAIDKEGRLGKRDSETVAVAAWALVHGLAALWLSRRLHGRLQTHDADVLAEQLTTLFVGSVLGLPKTKREPSGPKTARSR
jgi:AcrR family transcriptional regulator